MLHAGDSVPHFAVTTLGQRSIGYDEIWQRKNLLLVSMPDWNSAAAATYLSELANHMGQLTVHDTACVIIREQIEGVPCPGVVIADRWGEIYFVAEAETIAALPPAADLVEWLDYVQVQCPECQGEAR
jgi:hypothetical protein